MNRFIGLAVSAMSFVVIMASCNVGAADFEVTGPDGRRILLKDDGTWRYVEEAQKEGEAVLSLERKTDLGTVCRFVLRLVNNLPYEIRSLVPYYAAYRANGVIYDTVSSASAFTALKPGDQTTRELEFKGLGCADIVRVQVVGGDRCEMGELTKYSDVKGACLARVRVVESNLVRFDK
jgi:hypothetical protein